MRTLPFICLLILLFTSVACTKEGPAGPAGPTGPQGSATTYTAYITLAPSDWTYTNGMYRYDVDLASFGEGLTGIGSVMAFRGANDLWYALPLETSTTYTTFNFGPSSVQLMYQSATPPSTTSPYKVVVFP